MFDQGILFFCYLSDVTHTNLEIRNHSGNFWWLTAARARYYSVRKLVFSRSALQSAVHTRFNLLPISLHSHFFFVFLVKHLCFLLCVSSHLVALAGNYHTRPVSKSRLVALIFTSAIFHIWAWKSKFTPINLKQCPAFEQQGRPSRSRTD